MAWPEGGINTRLDLQLKQKLVMTPQLQQAIRLLQLSRLELQQEIQQEMLENPLIEEGLSDLPEDTEGSRDEREETASESDADTSEETTDELRWDRYDDDEAWDRIENRVTWEAPEERPSYEATLSRPTSLADHLLWQLGVASLTDVERAAGEALIGNMDDHGYLEATVDELVRGTDAIPSEVVERVLTIIQEFDPPGVGARNLTECLLIQVRLLGLADSLVATIIQNHLAALEKKHHAAIAKTCGVSVDDVLQAAKIIERLEPKPGRPFSAAGNFNIVPDVFVVKMDPREHEEGLPHFQPDTLEEESGAKEHPDEDQYAVLLNDEGLPKARISSYYESLLKSNSADVEKTRAYLEEKRRSAVWFIRSLEQRNRTIVKVAESIVKFQRGFMKDGVRSLKPLVLKQVAEDIEMHESTVSRVTASKYLHTPQGIYPFKFFFNGALAAVGGDRDDALSSVAVRDRIERMVAEEEPSRPLTDAKIAALLKRENVEVARRTISKYRAELHIAAASRRRRAG